MRDDWKSCVDLAPSVGAFVKVRSILCIVESLRCASESPQIDLLFADPDFSTRRGRRRAQQEPKTKARDRPAAAVFYSQYDLIQSRREAVSPVLMSISIGSTGLGSSYLYRVESLPDEITLTSQARPSRIGPAGPQVIKGTVNDPVTFPEASQYPSCASWNILRSGS